MTAVDRQTLQVVMQTAQPTRLNLVRDKQLEIQWQDGSEAIYSLSHLRSMCPCAQCKETRKASDKPSNKLSLTILPGNYSDPLTVVNAELVGNYALRLEWSDNHASGIYSFDYLRSIAPR